MKPFATLFILLLFPVTLLSQVIIKERLEIQPKLKIPLQATSTADQNTLWIDIHYYYPLSSLSIPWPSMGGLTQLELSTGQIDTISLIAKFPNKSVRIVRSPTIGPVPFGTTAEVKNYHGAEYNYGIPPPYYSVSIAYQPVIPHGQGDTITTQVQRRISYPNGSSTPYEVHGTIRYIPISKPTVSITNTKIKKYTINSTSPNYTATFTYSATPSGKYAPTITWTPQQTFNTQNYLNQIKPGDTLRIPVKVTATNIAGSATDTTGKLILIRHKELHHIKVFAPPDSINQSDSSLITIKAYRSDNTDITSTLPENMQVTFSLSGDPAGILTQTSTTLGEILAGKIHLRGISSNKYVSTVIVTGVLDGKSAKDTVKVTNPCIGIPICGTYTPPTLTFVVAQPSDLNQNNIPCNNPKKVYGGFRPLNASENLLEDFDVQVCKDSIDNKLHFRIPEIKAKVYLEMCLNNILADGLSLVNENDLWTLHPDSVCKVIEDLESWEGYPPELRNKYQFPFMVLKHELQHKQDYEDTVMTIKHILDKKIKNYTMDCQPITNELLTQAKQELKNIIINFLTDDAYRAWREKEKLDDAEKRFKNEFETNQKFKEFIQNLKKQMEQFYNVQCHYGIIF